jgi:translocation and assembly module TamA
MGPIEGFRVASRGLGAAVLVAAGAAAFAALPRAGAQAPPEGAPPAASSPAPAEEPAGEARPELAYEVEVTGLDDAPELEQLIRDAASLTRLSDRPPPSVVGLRRRAESDRAVVVQAMRSLGYYDGVVAIAVDPDRAPALATIAVTPGPRYSFARVALEPVEGATLPILPPTQEELGLAAGGPAVARAVVAAEARVVRRLAEAGYRYGAVPRRRVVVDHAAETMDVTYLVDAGPRIRFGEPRIVGTGAVKDSIVLGRLAWTPGDVYSPEAVDVTRRRLQELGAFTSVAVALPDEAPPAGPDGEATAPVTLTFSDRPRRFVGAGVRYTTAEGLGGTFFWGHRNLFGGAEQLRVQGEVSDIAFDTATDAESAQEEITSRLAVQFRKPDVLAVRQSLVLETEAERERLLGYDREGVTATARLERQVSDRLQVSYGVLGEVSRTRRTGRDEQGFALLGLPLGFSYDGADGLLNPTSGYRVYVTGTPFYGLNTGSSFLQNRVTATAYRDLSGDGRYVLAGRASLGSIVGGGDRDVPADRLFYVGGGGSVRGYAFQRAGRLDAAGDPIGGRSLVELGAELRMRVTETVGIVPFLDAGSVGSNDFPTLDEPLRYGAGVGLRYYTDFGPIRVDVATPLDRRDADGLFELYISIGQAF